MYRHLSSHTFVVYLYESQYHSSFRTWPVLLSLFLFELSSVDAFDPLPAVFGESLKLSADIKELVNVFGQKLFEYTTAKGV